MQTCHIKPMDKIAGLSGPSTHFSVAISSSRLVKPIKAVSQAIALRVIWVARFVLQHDIQKVFDLHMVQVAMLAVSLSAIEEVKSDRTATPRWLIWLLLVAAGTLESRR